MFKKFSSTTLLIIFILLIGLVLLNKFYFSGKSESTFTEEFVKVDTSLVNEIRIYPKAENGKEIILTRSAGGWSLQSGNVKAKADTAAVRNLLAGFSYIKSNALAGADRSVWPEFQIDDTSGSRIKLITSAPQTYEMVVGKFGYNAQARNGVTYIRHADEEAVYAIDGFLAFSVNQPVSGWRNKSFIHGNTENWTSLTFTYPGDSSFVLQKQNNEWMVNGQAADSSKTAQYLNGISSLQNGSFVDAYAPSSTPIYTLRIQGNGLSDPITVVAYPADSVHQLVLHSSLNPDAFFSEAQSHIAERIFPGRGTLIK